MPSTRRARHSRALFAGLLGSLLLPPAAPALAARRYSSSAWSPSTEREPATRARRDAALVAGYAHRRRLADASTPSAQGASVPCGPSSAAVNQRYLWYTGGGCEGFQLARGTSNIRSRAGCDFLCRQRGYELCAYATGQSMFSEECFGYSGGQTCLPLEPWTPPAFLTWVGSWKLCPASTQVLPDVECGIDNAWIGQVFNFRAEGCYFREIGRSRDIAGSMYDCDRACRAARYPLCVWNRVDLICLGYFGSPTASECLPRNPLTKANAWQVCSEPPEFPRSICAAVTTRSRRRARHDLAGDSAPTPKPMRTSSSTTRLNATAHATGNGGANTTSSAHMAVTLPSSPNCNATQNAAIVTDGVTLNATAHAAAIAAANCSLVGSRVSEIAVDVLCGVEHAACGQTFSGGRAGCNATVVRFNTPEAASMGECDRACRLAGFELCTWELVYVAGQEGEDRVCRGYTGGGACLPMHASPNATSWRVCDTATVRDTSQAGCGHQAAAEGLTFNWQLEARNAWRSWATSCWSTYCGRSEVVPGRECVSRRLSRPAPLCVGDDCTATPANEVASQGDCEALCRAQSFSMCSWNARTRACWAVTGGAECYPLRRAPPHVASWHIC